MNFTIQSPITKDFVFSKVSEEDIFCHYLGITSITKKLYVSKLRTDRNPTCGFYRSSKGILYFHDFATGDHYNCVSLVMAMYNCDYYKALKIIASDFKLIEDTPIKTKVIKSSPKFEDKGPSTIRVEIKDFSENELKWWKRYGIDLNILKKFHVYSCNSVFLNGNLFAKYQEQNYIFGYYGGKKDKLELWRIYFPKRKSYRFINNWDAKKLQGYEQLPESGKILVITKSMKDVMCLYSLGIPAIAPCSENLFIPETILNDLKKRFKYVVILYDNDLPGISNMCKIKKQYPELIYTWIPRKLGAKDISDYHKANGRESTLKLIKQFIEWRNRH